MSTAGDTGAAGTGTTASGTTPSTTGGGSADAGRGRNRSRFGRGGRGGRGSGSRRPTTTTIKKFEGRNDDLKGHVYDFTNPKETANSYTTTTEEIAEYIGRTYKMGNYIKRAIETMAPMTIPLPTAPTPDPQNNQVNPVEAEIFKQQISSYVKKQETIESGLQNAYSLIWGQCSEGIRAKLQGMPTHSAISQSGNPVDLLANIKTVMFQFQTTKYTPHAIYDCKRRLYIQRQDKEMTVPDYYKMFKNNVDVVEHNGGTLGIEEGVVKMVLAENGLTMSGANEGQMSNAQAKAREYSLACAFILGADKIRFGKLLEDLENSYTQGDDKYPKTMTDAYKLLVNWKQDPRNLMRAVRPGTTTGEVAFVNVDDDVSEMTGTALVTVAGRDGREHPNIRCYQCQRMGHYASSCPGGDDSSGVQLLMDGIANDDNEFTFHIRDPTAIPDSWVLLDSQSTVNMFSNPNLLRNIRPANKCMNVRGNAGVSRTNMIGDFKGYPEPVWYDPNGIANILSMAQVERYFPVTYGDEKCFIVHKKNGMQRRFVKSDRGLYYLDTATARSDAEPTEDQAVQPTEEQPETILLSTVEDKKSKYTVRDYRQAELARKIQNMIGRPSLRDYLRIVDGNQLRNCPVTRSDILAAEDIFGPNLGSLKGKTVRKASPTTTITRDPLPLEIKERYMDVTICLDIMFVNKVAFVITISRNIKFITVEFIASRHQGTLMASLQRINNVYAQRGFRITDCNADNEFEPLRNGLKALGIELNTVGEDEHVPEIERCIRTVKERTRATWNTLPFKRIPVRMIIEMVTSSVMWLNMFPPTDGVSNTLSPRALVTGLQVDYKKYCRIEFGSYVQTHEEHDNSMGARTIGAIALRATGNAQGGHYFLSLTTGRRIHRHRWTELPMPADVIDRVHALARRSRAAIGLTFGWRDGTEILDEANEEYDHAIDDADSDYEPNDDDDYDYDDYDDYDSDAGEPINPVIAGVDHHEQEPEQDNNNAIDADAGEEYREEEQQVDEERPTAVSDDDASPTCQDNNDDQIETPGVPEAEDQPEIPGVMEAEVPGVPDEIPGVSQDDNNPPDVAQQMDDRYGARRLTGLRPRRQRDYSRHLGMSRVQKPQDYEYTMLHAGLEDLEHTALTQYSVKKGLQVFGQAGAEAVLQEMKQLHDRKVGQPENPAMLTREEKKKALEYLMFLKKKRSGKIKGRGCADGRKQRVYKTKEETSSPTVTTESLFLSCVIDAKEGRDVATCDIPGAFMQADMDEVIHVRLAGPLATLLARVDPESYEKYIAYEKGKPVIYIKLKKALYGTLQAALLFWKDLTGALKEWGFELNPYDECVANKDIDGSQCTILWHVDDLKISHLNPDVVSDIINKLNARYGKEAPLTVTRGKVHEYLGMTIDFSVTGKVIIQMDDYVEGILAEAREDMAGEATTPAAEHLFNINNNPDPLGEELSQYFHTMTAKLLFLSKRARPDLQEAIAFLTTRVKGPDTDDYKKLGRVIKYLRKEPRMALTLEADNTHVIKWWIDAAFAVHPDMKSHTGATMSMGKGSVYSTSVRQKLNTKSSTEAELVGVDDVMPMVLWTRYFLEAQGYNVDTDVYQDNQSAMLLEKNGRASSGKRTRHINIRYFFVADRVQSGEVRIKYCPTDDMLGDYFTKPLQGSKFRKFRDQILNVQRN